MFGKIGVALDWDQTESGLLHCVVVTSVVDPIWSVNFSHIASIKEIDDLADSLFEALASYRTIFLRRRVPREYLDRDLLRQRLREEAKYYFEQEERRMIRKRWGKPRSD